MDVATLTAVSQFSDLRILMIDSKHVRLEDLKHLVGPSKLGVLDFASAPVSSMSEAKGLNHIGEFKQLVNLIIRNLPDARGHFSFLSKLQNLQSLTVASQLDRQDWRHLGTLAKLEGLHIRGPYVDSGSLSRLKSLKGLQVYDEISLDESLMAAIRSRNLQVLYLPKNGTSDEALDELRRAMPQCHIERVEN
ncbi:hypothetical protein OAS39_11095 [Pirellulales bacterium]|nr:hypothetical protein [Pirellulales bacterium]